MPITKKELALSMRQMHRTVPEIAASLHCSPSKIEEFFAEQDSAETGTSEPGAEEFHITDECGANWYLRSLANYEAEKQRVTANAALIIKRIDTDAEGLRHQYEGELQEFVRRELARKKSKRKSLTLLQGTAQFRTVPGGLRVVSAEEAEYHATQEGIEGAFVSKFSAAAYREIAEAALQNGEILPGVEIVPDRESFSVRFGKKQEGE